MLGRTCPDLDYEVIFERQECPSGLYRGQALFTATETAPFGGDGLLDSQLGRLSRT